MLIMIDFLNIFPIELLGLPLEKEIDFPINLVIGTIRISLLPY